jgi:hypothetical protein
MILQGPDSIYTVGLSALEKSLGIDLKINQNGDLELNNLNDIKLIRGVENASQAIFIKLSIEPGSLLYHPELGTDLQIGSKTKNALQIKTQILKSLSKDERFDGVEAFVTVLGDIVLTDLKVTLANTGVEVPLQFSTPV